MLEKHPALREELVEIEKSLQKYSEAHAEEAPEHLRSKILDRLEIADEENARAPAVDIRREAQILVHGQSGEADIHPVEEREQV